MWSLIGRIEKWVALQTASKVEAWSGNIWTNNVVENGWEKAVKSVKHNVGKTFCTATEKLGDSCRKVRKFFDLHVFYLLNCAHEMLTNVGGNW